MRTLAALLDMVGAHGFSFEALRKSLSEKYGYDISKHVVERLAVEALLHVITSMEDLAGELEEVTELVERFEKLLKQWDDLQSRLEDLGVMNKGEKHYMFSDVMKQIAYVLELKQGEDARQYYEAVKKLIDRIAGESNIEEACYREVERFKEREILRRLCKNIDRLDIAAPTLSTMLRRDEIASEIRELKGELEKAAEALNKFYEKMVDAITTYQIEVMTTGRLAGWCRICGGRSDEKLLSLASSLKKMARVAREAKA
jgi:ATP-dependent Lon protease